MFLFVWQLIFPRLCIPCPLLFCGYSDGSVIVFISCITHLQPWIFFFPLSGFIWFCIYSMEFIWIRDNSVVDYGWTWIIPSSFSSGALLFLPPFAPWSLVILKKCWDRTVPYALWSIFWPTTLPALLEACQLQGEPGKTLPSQSSAFQVYLKHTKQL